MHALTRQLALLVLTLAWAANAFAGSLSLAWDPVSDPRLVGYKVYYGTSSRNYTGQIDVGNATTRTVSNLTDGATYYFAVTAYDASRVESGFSNEVVGTVPGGAPVANFTVSTTSGPAPLSLNFTSTSTGTITTYAWVFGDGTTSSAQNPAKTYSSAGSYTVSLTVTGPGGSNTRSMPGYITVTAPADTTPPTAPGSLAATPSSPTAVNLSWTASTDNVGVTGYRVERCTGAGCTGFTQIATPTGTTYSDTGRTASTIYRYRVRAVDAAGNLSAYSAVASVTTPSTADTTPPTVPTGLTVSGSTSTMISLGWNASTDNVGVTGYRVERCTGASCTSFAQVGTPTGTSYVDTGRAPSTTYRYRVRAIDAAGNLSAYSLIVAATTAAEAMDITADFDGDGKSDLIWRNASTGATAMSLMNGTQYASWTILHTDPNWVVAHAGDFNGDGRTDLVWRHAVTGENVMWLMNGVAYAGGGSLLTSTSWTIVRTGDLNGDGRTDLVWRNAATGEVVVWLMNGAAFAGGGTLLTDPTWNVTHVADFNGDGRDDLLWRNSATGEIAMWLMNGAAFAGGGTVLADPAWTATHVRDFNGDGRADIVWRNAAGATAMWLMNGSTFVGGAGLLSDPNWNVVAADDLDGNGRADILWRNAATGDTAAWLMNGVSIVGGGGLLTGATWSIVGTADLNGDGRADILWSNGATGEKVAWLMNGLGIVAGGTLLTSTAWAVSP